MKQNKYLVVGGVWVVIGLLAFLKLGRPVYMPIVHMVKGKETVESRVTKLESRVFDRLTEGLSQAGYEGAFPEEIILAAFKEERILQVYAKGNDGVALIKSYPFTAFSGQLGPKLQEGDRQIPEGVYEVEYLNPNSAYYLSIKVNYPNELDRAKSRFADPKEMGGDIFIHGKAATIGCIPIGDEAIEEVFLMVSKAMKKGVKVIISPRDFRLTDEYPQIKSIDWEVELYDRVKNELRKLPSS